MNLIIKLIRKIVILIIVYSLISATGLVAQSSISLSGNVYNELNKPLVGALLTYKSQSSFQTISDSAGFFLIEVPDTLGILQVYFPDLESVFVQPIPASSPLNITLKKEAFDIGYGTSPSQNVVGSIIRVDQKKLNYLPLQHVLYGLQGWATGIDVVQSSARPGALPTLTLRGNRSFSGSDEPLYVVDGLPLAQGLNLDGLNPEDIASIEILKDAASSAIYGLRASNGVILINTRRGNTQASGFSYHAYYGIGQAQVPTQMMTGGEFAEYRREAYRNGNSYTTPFPNPAEDFKLFSLVPQMWASVAQAYEWDDQANLVPKYRPATAAEKAYYAQWNMGPVDQIPVYNPAKVRTTDWGKLALRTGQKQNHHLAYQHNGQKYSERFALGYYNELGVQLTQGFERVSSHFALDYRGTKSFKWGLSFNAALNQQDWGADVYEIALNQNPLALPYDAAGNILLQPENHPFRFNPLLSIDGEVDERNTQRLLSHVYTEFKLGKALSYRLNLGSDLLSQQHGVFQEANTQARRGGFKFASFDQNHRTTWLYESILNYSRLFQTRHQLQLTLVHSLQNDRWSNEFLSSFNLPEKIQSYHFLKTREVGPYLTSTGTFTLRSPWHSGMARIHYAYADKYLFSATARFDARKYAPEAERNKLHWALALGWKLHEEAFLKNSTLVNELKLRASFGSLGKAGSGFLGNADGYSTEYYQSHQSNLGVDFALADRRLQGSIDFYHIRSAPQIRKILVAVPPNIEVRSDEIGRIQNSGFELSLQSLNLKNQHWQWNTQLVLSVNREQVKIPPGKASIEWVNNHPKTTYFNLQPIGVWSTDEAAQAQQYLAKPGQVKYADLNGDFKIDRQDWAVLGSNAPDYYGTLFNVVSYKNWEFSFLIYARVGQFIPNRYYSPVLYGNTTEAQFVAQQYWTPASQENVQYYRPSNSGVNDLAQSFKFQDASFAKIRSLTLSHQFSKNHLAKLKVAKLSISLSVYNPFLITAYKLTDPEYFDPGLDRDREFFHLNPGERALLLGVKVDF